MSDPTSTPSPVPDEPRWVCALGNPFCSALMAKPRLNGDNRHAECWHNNTRPAASSPDKGTERRPDTRRAALDILKKSGEST